MFSEMCSLWLRLSSKGSVIGRALLLPGFSGLSGSCRYATAVFPPRPARLRLEDNHRMINSNHLPAPSDTGDTRILLPMLIGGILLGGGANISALISGRPIWAGLLYQSGFGMLGMILVAAVFLILQARRDRQKDGNSVLRMKPSSVS